MYETSSSLPSNHFRAKLSGISRAVLSIARQSGTIAPDSPLKAFVDADEWLNRPSSFALRHGAAVRPDGGCAARANASDQANQDHLGRVDDLMQEIQEIIGAIADQ